MKMEESHISEEALRLDPREYTIKPATIISPMEFEASRALVFPTFQKLGKTLTKLGALPLQEEPRGSKNFVTSGNFSIRGKKGGFFITGNGINKEYPKPEDILYVERIDYGAGEIFTAGSARYSRETLIHHSIYQTFPQTNAVIHTHDDFALSFDDSPRTDGEIFFANANESQRVVELLKKILTFTYSTMASLSEQNPLKRPCD